MFQTANSSQVKNTTHKVIIPFYVYAAISLLAATILLLFSTEAFTQHSFHPHTLAITHVMALGWGTMMILGASHQLVPVLIEGKLFSNTLAILSFVTAGAGIPLLVYSFYVFNLGWPAWTGGILINLAILFYIINLAGSMLQSKKENVHAIFIFSAAAWLLLTTLVGFFLMVNFTQLIFTQDSVHYLSLHAHLGIIGWFLLMVTGVGSRLIPMFLISKYNNEKSLWIIYFLINAALFIFIIQFFFFPYPLFYLVPAFIILLSLTMFGYFCYKAYKERIRKHVDKQMKISLLSIFMTALPVFFLIVILFLLYFSKQNSQLVLAYGFTIFFGWITAIILGMTFKTLPFIVWNKVYHAKAGLGKTPNPKDLFSENIFRGMGIFYLSGFFTFAAGILFSNDLLKKSSAVLLIIMAVLYNWNIFKMLFHKPILK